jgi:hypothetical protein
VYSINFTTTAYFCSALGLSALFLSLQVNPNSIAISPVLACFLGFLWRHQAFVSLVPIALILLVFQFRKITLSTLIKNLLALTIPVSLASYLDRLAYTSSDRWMAFHEFHSLHVKIKGNSVFTSLIERYGLTELALKLQVPEINLRLFNSWIYSISPTNLEFVGRAAQLIKKHTLLTDLRIGEIAQSQTVGISALIASLAILILLVYSSKRVIFASSLSMILLYLILAESYLEQFNRLPGYVIEGLRFSTIVSLISLFILASNSKARNFQLKRFFPVFLLFSILPFALYGFHLIRIIPDYSRNAMLQQRQLLENVRDYEQVFSQPAIDFVNLVDAPLSSPWSDFKLNSINLMTIGWTASTPHETDRLGFFGIDETFNIAISTGKISIIDVQGSVMLKSISEYMYENYKICGLWDSVSIVFRDQPVQLSTFRQSDECKMMDFSDPLME